MSDVEICSRIQSNKELIFNLLNKNKVSKVVIYFDGGGDSGQINDVSILPKTKKIILSEPVIGSKCLRHVEYKNGERKPVYYSDDDPEMNLEFVMTSICYDILEYKHGGWEIDDGSYGEFTFDVKTKSIGLEFHERYTDVRSFEEKY